MARDYQLPHLLTRWRSDGQRDMYGSTGYSVDVFPCRYQEANRIYVREDGQNERSRAYVYTKNDDLDLGDIVIKGDYSDRTEPVQGSFEIKSKRITQNQRGTRTEYRYIF